MQKSEKEIGGLLEMSENLSSRKMTRRDFLKLGGISLLALVGGKAVPALARGMGKTGMAAPRTAIRAAVMKASTPVELRLAATDGFISLPGRDPLYVFGFLNVPFGAEIADLAPYKGNVQVPSPIIGIDEDDELHLKLTNIGLVMRPDLDDSHTVHWHGFRNPIAIFDGVPEASISVPPNRDFTYAYRLHDEGTYMYHCHFEDVEHVQMGMTGIVFVRPAQNKTGAAGGPVARLGGDAASPVMGYAYNDGVAPTNTLSTAYDREFALLLNEIDPRPHDLLVAVQEFIWSNYKASYWVINGRAYPDTIKLNHDPSLPNQPLSSLIQVKAGERILLRFANLGYEQHAMQLPSIPLRVVGEDATFLRSPSGNNLSYFTNTIYIGPGEARDVMFNAPAYSSSATVFSDGVGNYNRYLLMNRNSFKCTNNGATSPDGLGGMVTEVRVYHPSTPLPQQIFPNETYA